ncbi:hypothetical protein PybrP1_009063 [[Pythium] brassicae (nom. inval.)]|nr:hypothetical protein PybrP1_009063 [[Pythium] brassicae (nom. inval.)]
MVAECCAVLLSRNVFARLPPYNPFVGTFHHAPSAGNRGAVYFSGDIVGMSELEERKKFRHHPLTGTFHSLPGYYDPLHRLSQFRSADDDVDTSDTDSMRSFIAVDIPDGEDLLDQPVMLLNQPKSLSRMHSDSNCVLAPDALGRPRRFSDADADSFFGLGTHNNSGSSSSIVSKYYSSASAPTSAATARHSNASSHSGSADAAAASYKRELLIDVSARPPLARDRARSYTAASTPMNPHSRDDELLMRGPASDEEENRSSFSNVTDLAKLDQQLRRAAKKRRSSAASSTESEGGGGGASSIEAFANGLARLELRKSVSTSELSEGFISTGKGIFRKVAYRTSLADRERSRSIQSPTRANGASQTAHWSPDAAAAKAEAENCTEYTQEAPRIPLNPFVARRLNDGEEIRIMAVHRSTRRDGEPHVINPGSDSEDESPSYPKPYFIHEEAVTDQYELCGADQLGDGSYAVVKPAIRRVNGKEVAIKQIHKRYLRTEESKAAVDREIEIHLRLRHKHIVRLYEVYETTDFLYLVMAKATKGNLKQLMQRKRRLPDNQDSNDTSSPTTRRSSPSSPLDPHADVKVRDLQVEICDFGLSVKVPDVRFYKLTGDVHKVPFTGLTGTPGEPADFSDRVWTTVSARAKELVEGLLEADPAKRLTAADALAHGWFDTATFAL